MNKFFEIKKGRTYKMVASSGIVAVNKYCEENNIKNWRMVGMMSRAETRKANAECEFIG
jgi:hypothetical protein